MKDADVIIIGAGLAGLRAALELSRAGLSVLVFEREEKVGGRVRTTNVAGYTLDHGFQVILSAYPELKSLPEFNRIPCRGFASGARIRVDGRFRDFYDPKRHPEKALATLASPICSLVDLARLFNLVGIRRASGVTPAERPTSEMLIHKGFSKRFRESFLEPFLRGVLLDPALGLDFGVASFYLQMFSRGDALLPSGGVQAFPDLLAGLIGRSHIRLGTSVDSISKNEVVLESGETFTADHVVCATDPLRAAELGSPDQTLPMVGSTTVYFSSPEAPFSDPLIVLNAEGGPITTLAVPTNVQPSYAPAGRALIAATAIGEYALRDEATLVTEIREQLALWYGDKVKKWQYLRLFRTPLALTSRPRLGKGWHEKDGVIYIGDYLTYSSQNGALLSGRSLAERLIEDSLCSPK
jgi:phytoene dehydrogenase-like protein